MGISCKPTGKMKSIFQKIENEQAKEKAVAKQKATKKETKKS